MKSAKRIFSIVFLAAYVLFAGNALASVVDGQYEALEGADALMVATEWNQFRTPDFERVKAMLQQPLVFDGRNLYSPSSLAALGLAYFSVGRKSD